MISVLYVDEEITHLDVGKHFLEKTGTFKVDTASSAKEALQKLIIKPCDAVVSGFLMPGMNGIELLTAVRKEYPRLPFIIFTGKGREEVAIEAIEKGADFYLWKGGSPRPQFAELSQKITQVVMHRQAEEELHKSEETFRTFVNESSDGFVIFDENGAVIEWNPAQECLTGISKSDALGKSIFDIQTQLMVPDQKTPERLRDIETSVSEVLKNPGSYQFSQPSEIEIVHKDGKRRLIQQTIFPIRTSGSHRIGSIAHDITRSKHDENLLKTSETRYRRLFETAQDAILILDADSGTIIDANKFIIDLLGYPLEDLLGKKLWEIGFIKDKTVAEKAFADLKQDEYIRYEDLPLETKDGRSIDVEFVSNLYAVNHSRIIQCNIRDITIRKRAENALALASKKLNLLSSITRHDILNQLTVLSGSIQLASEIAEKPEIAMHLNRAQTAAEIIRQQIGFTREYENIGVRAPAWQKFSAVSHSAMSQLHPDTMVIDLPKNDFEVYADPLFEKVFLNLIDNTWKHGGKVSRISISSRETDRGLIICFEDDGSGIASENKTHIFERGFGKHTGLGLFFSREILSITGITITENGKPGKGARFEILVPKGSYKFTKAGINKGRKRVSTLRSAQ